VFEFCPTKTAACVGRWLGEHTKPATQSVTNECSPAELSFVHCANENSHAHRRDAWLITCSSVTAADGGARVKG